MSHSVSNSTESDHLKKVDMINSLHINSVKESDVLKGIRSCICDVRMIDFFIEECDEKLTLYDNSMA